MHTYKYVPAICRKDGETDPKWEGSITLRVLSMDDCIATREKAQSLEKGEDGVVAPTTYNRFVASLAKEWKDRFVEVTLMRKSDKQEFKCWDDLQYGAPCHAILTECVLGLLNGFDEGNG